MTGERLTNLLVVSPQQSRGEEPVSSPLGRRNDEETGFATGEAPRLIGRRRGRVSLVKSARARFGQKPSLVTRPNYQVTITSSQRERTPSGQRLQNSDRHSCNFAEFKYRCRGNTKAMSTPARFSETAWNASLFLLSFSRTSRIELAEIVPTQSMLSILGDSSGRIGLRYCSLGKSLVVSSVVHGNTVRSPVMSA